MNRRRMLMSNNARIAGPVLVLSLAGALALSLAGCHATFHQPPVSPDVAGRIAGRVMDENGGPLSLVKIDVSGPNVRLQALSDTAGQFLVIGLAPGSYKLSASSTGFHGAKTTVTVKPRETTQVEFRLRLI